MAKAYSIDGLNDAALQRIIAVLIREKIDFEAFFNSVDWSMDYSDLPDSTSAEVNQILREYKVFSIVSISTKPRRGRN
jgi:hypothetical protein